MTSDWFPELGVATSSHREARASAYDRRACEVERDARALGLSAEQVRARGKWYRSRSKGQRWRIQNAQECQRVDVVVVTCGECHSTVEKPRGCDVALACAWCRGKLANAKRSRFGRARHALLQLAQCAGLLRRHRPGGRWSEKLVTLTLPHLATMGVRARIVWLLDAWRHFARRLNGLARRFRCAAGPHWFRAYEWTEGDDGAGHPHVHIWYFGPFLPQKEVADWWAAALRAASPGWQRGEHLVVDVRRVDDGERGALEVIKYLTKDIVAGGGKVPAATYAEVYCAFDGARLTQASRRFMALAGRRACRCKSCQGVGTLHGAVRPHRSLRDLAPSRDLQLPPIIVRQPQQQPLRLRLP